MLSSNLDTAALYGLAGIIRQELAEATDAGNETKARELSDLLDHFEARILRRV
jgi:hypothetical protein